MKILKTFLSRPRPRPKLLLQDQDQDQDSGSQDQDQDQDFIFVLEAPRDQDFGLKDYITVINILIVLKQLTEIELGLPTFLSCNQGECHCALSCKFVTCIIVTYKYNSRLR